ncbi:hypothetical protein [Natronococcus amylolyticus]|nr:hypothetical protein [Natronococcus amylolyticus]
MRTDRTTTALDGTIGVSTPTPASGGVNRPDVLVPDRRWDDG